MSGLINDWIRRLPVAERADHEEAEAAERRHPDDHEQDPVQGDTDATSDGPARRPLLWGLDVDHLRRWGLGLLWIRSRDYRRLSHIGECPGSIA